ncbi:MAG: hypothetical protein LBE81_05500 [Azonexus sp.]|jgi:hypothetical protein|uniref:hypothetical protein n=1 Tax=Azonexus sp. TaxID=1872668 RepID=UPI0028266354|nr:hypothetical protein [Azonexus sp.]MDR0776076.1 hypothetical protein [Azonexus sp.]
MDNPPSCRSFLEPIRFFKGNASLAPSYIDKTGNTCDKRPFAPEGSKVLVFASVYQGKAVELLRVTPQEDKTASGALTLQYTSAMRQVEALSRTKKP